MVTNLKAFCLDYCSLQIFDSVVIALQSQSFRVNTKTNTLKSLTTTRKQFVNRAYVNSTESRFVNEMKDYITRM